MNVTSGEQTTARAVLVVDDEELIRQLLQQVLPSYGISVRVAASGLEAIEVCRREGAGIGAALIDIQMRGMNGPDTLRALRAVHPGLLCCFMSGDVSDEVLAGLRGQGVACVFAKPPDLDEVAGVLQVLLSS